mmetsp:Transcript_24223/g.95374  ORF Transcript_24223/g.95374 Transcript_24223/m.95374 type:complete len:159 (-) Transcript_24223:2439-2915(-)|eukprot:CAMPEP_0113964858 /NCGR_PEP_ID=MMETSP0011_2-20120614/7400_1 /TAXON_ID=101924 /ORGANISM="Rhodosorus marinus" /LENGTH=158 /DNA_ID=CAMNT_0000977261 /DNA_START=104 /DNA_END=580 /DNA_ORIENTATION=+ /assembly_acc=CAM_ASM_000156
MIGFANVGVLSRGPAMHRPRVQPRRAKVAVKAELVQKITGEELEVELNDAELPLVVDFYAAWCGPCQFMLPELEKIAAEYDGRVKVLKVDSDEETDIATMLQVRALPTLFFVHKNELRFRFEGALMKEQLETVIEEVFFKKEEEGATEESAPAAEAAA